MDNEHQPPGRAARSGGQNLRLGASGEALAVRHLEALGCQVVAQNWRVHEPDLRGEIDVVVRDGHALVVVEVKTRRGRGHGHPLEAVTHDKQRRLRQLAMAFLRTSGIHAREIRFDVIGVVLDGGDAQISHVRSAF